ncbi:MAG: aminotransferase class IV [Syntrophobacteraceae bacterium]
MSEPAASGGAIIWLNGSFTPLEEARISPLDRGFLYGDGFFETLRAENGRALYLQLHLQRLYGSLSAFRLSLDPTPDWEGVARELLAQNMLTRDPAALKIIVTRGIAAPLGLPPPDRPTLCITAQKYDPPAPELYGRGWKLHIFKEGYPPPFAPHKSLNYLYHLSARQAALDAGCHEAILTDQNGRVTETSAGTLVARTSGRWWAPESPHRLAGTTIQKLSAILEAKGDKIEQHPAGQEELFSAKTVWVLNSLIGIMPVCRIDGRQVADPACSEAAHLRKLLFARG